MIEQRTPFSWIFSDQQRHNISIFRSSLNGCYSLRRIHKEGNHWWNENLSTHKTLEEAISASEALTNTAK